MKSPFPQPADEQPGAVGYMGWECPRFTRSHLGVAKPILLTVHVDGAQQLLRSVFAVNKLPFGDGVGIENPVAEGGDRLMRYLPAAGCGGGSLRGEGPLATQSWEGVPFMHFALCPGPGA